MSFIIRVGAAYVGPAGFVLSADRAKPYTSYDAAKPDAAILGYCGRNVEILSTDRPILELSPNGRGFTASETRDAGHTWIYRGDIGAQPRAWWRAYARRNGFKLREVR